MVTSACFCFFGELKEGVNYEDHDRVTFERIFHLVMNVTKYE